MEDQRNKFEKLVAPTYEEKIAFGKKIKDLSGYIVIGVISLITVFIYPLLCGAISGDFSLYFPTTAEGWFVWIFQRVAIAVSNVSIFVMFKKQAKINVRDNENFKKANELLNVLTVKEKVKLPRSPQEMNRKEYIEKGTIIFIGTFLSTIVITSLVIRFDLITFVSCLLTIIFTLCFSFVTMLKNEQYWTDEYYLYAQMIYNKYSEKKEE